MNCRWYEIKICKWIATNRIERAYLFFVIMTLISFNGACFIDFGIDK